MVDSVPSLSSLGPLCAHHHATIRNHSQSQPENGKCGGPAAAVLVIRRMKRIGAVNNKTGQVLEKRNSRKASKEIRSY